MNLRCNICQEPLEKTGKRVCCPTCGARYWPHENPK